jgi:hypothetical protein
MGDWYPRVDAGASSALRTGRLCGSGATVDPPQAAVKAGVAQTVNAAIAVAPWRDFCR